MIYHPTSLPGHDCRQLHLWDKFNQWKPARSSRIDWQPKLSLLHTCSCKQHIYITLTKDTENGIFSTWSMDLCFSFDSPTPVFPVFVPRDKLFITNKKGKKNKEDWYQIKHSSLFSAMDYGSAECWSLTSEEFTIWTTNSSASATSHSQLFAGRRCVQPNCSSVKTVCTWRHLCVCVCVCVCTLWQMLVPVVINLMCVHHQVHVCVGVYWLHEKLFCIQCVTLELVSY